MKRISRNLTAAALASSLTMAGVAAASAEENTELNGNDLVDAVVTAGEAEGENGTEEAGEAEGENGAEDAGEAEGENGEDPIIPINAPAEGNDEKPTGENKPTGETKPTGENKPTGETKPTGENKPGKGENKPTGENKPGKGEGKPGKDNAGKKEKSSFDDFKAKLSSEEGKPTGLGIAAIVVGVLGAIAAAVPAAAQALNIKLPF